MSDIRMVARSLEIQLPDESLIELDLNITIKTDSGNSIANDRISHERLDRTLSTIQFMLITVLEKSPDEMMELVEKHAS